MRDAIVLPLEVSLRPQCSEVRSHSSLLLQSANASLSLFFWAVSFFHPNSQRREIKERDHMDRAVRLMPSRRVRLTNPKLPPPNTQKLIN